MKYSKKIIFLSIVSLFLFVGIFESTRLFSVSRIGFNFPLILHLVVLFLSFLSLGALFYFSCIKNENLSELAKGISSGVYSILVFFIFLEAFFIFYPKTHSGGNIALSNISWSSYYNSSKNEYDFRGRPIGDLKRKKKVYVIGDSFTAGWGIKNIKNRYSDLLEKELGSDYRVINMGVCGYGTKNELYVLDQFLNVSKMKKPDLIVWQYYFNDILSAGYPTPDGEIDPYPKEFSTVKYFVENSFFLNFVYWLFPKEYNQDSVEYYLDNYFKKEREFKNHLIDLLGVVRLCKEKQIPIVFVMFPYLNDLNRTCPPTTFISEALRGAGAEVVNMCDSVSDIDLMDRIVNCNDAHPSVRIHKLTAGILYRLIKEKNSLN